MIVITWQGCIARILILMIGVVTGVIVYLLMAFMHFEGCDGILDYKNAKIGLVGSVLILIGGFVGACLKRWAALLPGTIVILMAYASAYSVLWILVVLTVLLLLYCCIPQQKNQEEMRTILTDDFDGAFDVGYETEEMQTYKDEKDSTTTAIQ